MHQHHRINPYPQPIYMPGTSKAIPCPLAPLFHKPGNNHFSIARLALAASSLACIPNFIIKKPDS